MQPAPGEGMKGREGHDGGRQEKRKQEKRCSWEFVPSSTPIQLSYFFSLDRLLLSVMSQPLFCLSSSIVISRRRSLPFFPSHSPLCLGKRRSRNKAINKKSTAFSVPPYYGLLMYAFCCSITHQPQINALIFPSCQIDFCGRDNGAERSWADLYTVRRFPNTSKV